MLLSLQSAVGIAAILGIAWALSERRAAVRWRAIGMGLAVQLTLAVLLTQVPPVRAAFAGLDGVVTALTAATRQGTSFVFGYLGGGDPPFPTSGPGSGFVLAFQALPLILVISAISALLFHWNVIQPIVRGFAWVLRRTLGIDGPTGVSTVMDIFVGMIEAPLVVRPYLAHETRSGLFVMMTAGLATIAGTMMVVYATMLDGVVANPLAQLLTASILAAPGAVAIALVMVPETRERADEGDTPVILPRDPGDNMMSVIARGAIDAVPLILNIVAMLIVLIALVALVNMIIGHLPDVAGAPLTLQRIFGWVLAPLGWLIGIPWSEAPTAGALLGTKTVLNEMVAYADMARLDPAALSPRSRIIMTYALCGFANLGSLGIMIGGLGAMIPERRAELIALAPKSLISGLLATCLSAAIVGVLTPG